LRLAGPLDRRRDFNETSSRTATHIEIDGKIWKIIRVPARQAGQGRRLRAGPSCGGIEDGSVIDKNLPRRREVPPGSTPSRARCSTSTTPATRRSSLDSRDYEQIEIPTGALGDAMQWVLAQRRRRGPLRRRTAQRRPGRPGAIEMKVTQDRPRGQGGPPPPGGGTKAGRRWSPAWVVQVPLFIDEGEDGAGRYPHRRIHLPRVVRRRPARRYGPSVFAYDPSEWRSLRPPPRAPRRRSRRPRPRSEQRGARGRAARRPCLVIGGTIFRLPTVRSGRRG